MALVFINKSNPCAILAESYQHSGIKGAIYGSISDHFMPRCYPESAYEPYPGPISGRMVYRGTKAVLEPIYQKFRFASRIVVSASGIDREPGEVATRMPKDIFNAELGLPIDLDLMDYPHLTFADLDTPNPFRRVGFQSVEGVLQFCRNLELLYVKVAQWIYGCIQLSVAKGLKSHVNWGSFLGLTQVKLLDMVAPGVTTITGPINNGDITMIDAEEDILMEDSDSQLTGLIFHPLESNVVRAGLLAPYNPNLPGLNVDYYTPSAYLTQEDEDVPGVIDYLVKDINGAIPL
ncbi:hypothetical protein PQX77_015262 [Marasmius sp. AFHP31]|nr:hypothetical protein PQX77_015262 [Marasmius sp. AFHP31]